MDGGGDGGGSDFGGGRGGGFSSGGGDFGGGGGGFSSGGGDFCGGVGFSSGGGFSSNGGTDFGGTDFGGGGFTTSNHNNFGYSNGHNTIVHPINGVGFVPGPHGGYTGTHYTTTNNFGQPGSNVTVYGAQPATIYQTQQPYNSASCARPMIVVLMFCVFFVIFVLLSVLIPVVFVK